MDEQVERGAIGLFHTMINAMNNTFTKKFVDEIILPEVSSICTDGVNTNTGEEGGLWFYLQKEIEHTNSDIPLVKIWCVAHRANLTFNDLTSKNPTVSTIISTMSSISSFFHKSGLRTSALKKIANDNGLQYLTMPKYFEIRSDGLNSHFHYSEVF